ncbi:MAG: hypothetical protein ACOC97_00085 [Myxococcota bacterium]
MAACIVALGIGTTGAQAQEEDWEEPETADEGADEAPEPASDPEPAYEPEPAPAPAAAPNDDADADDGEDVTDHEFVVGHAGIGFFGTRSIPTGVASGSQTVAILGTRYWLMPEMGIDVGVGVGFSKDKAKQDDMVVEDAMQLGLSLHAGIPLAPIWGDHYTFIVVPELDVGFGTSKDDLNAPDTSNFGLLVSAGVRLGAEIQFGFIGIPRLALQASVGGYLQFAFAKTSDPFGDTKATDVGLATSLAGEVSDIFNGNIAVLYYF